MAQFSALLINRKKARIILYFKRNRINFFGFQNFTPIFAKKEGYADCVT